MLRLDKVSRRNTQAHLIEVGGHAFFFSYATAVAYRGPLGSCRVANKWGPTTGRHIGEAGVSQLPIVPTETMNSRIKHALIDVGLLLFRRELGESNE